MFYISVIWYEIHYIYSSTYCMSWLTPSVIMMTTFLVVPALFRELAKTNEPREYESLVDRVTQASCSTILITNLK